MSALAGPGIPGRSGIRPNSDGRPRIGTLARSATAAFAKPFGHVPARHGGRLAWLAAAVLALATALVLSSSAPAEDDLPNMAKDDFPHIRRIKVPVNQDEFWPPGDWQPVLRSEFEEQLDAARAARRARPAAFIERAEYSATLVDAELKEARLEWTVRRPDARLGLLSLGRLNLNVSDLGWSDVESGKPPAAALWGAGPAGPVVVVNRPSGQLVADWSLPGRRLTASTEFDVELAPAAVSQLRLRVPAGLVLTSTAGDLSGPETTAEPGWNEWRLNLGSQSSCRLRFAPPPDAHGDRPLILVHSNLNYDVRSEAVRVLAEFSMNVLESGVRELRLSVDPEVQVTAVEYGDDGAVDWQSLPISGGQEIVVRLPDAAVGEGHTLQVQGIAQVKQFAAWTLPRIRMQNSVEATGRATLRLPAPFLAADIRTDGYRQVELTSGADDAEILVFRRFREDGTITVVPADSKPDLACRTATLIQPDRHQWSLVSECDWKAASGSAFTVSFAISGYWEIVDVRIPSGGRAGELAGWEVQETDQGRRLLHLHFLNALKTDRPQRARISARRLPPADDAPAIVPPLIPVDANDVEQLLVVATGSEWRPVLIGASGIEPVDIRDFPEATRELDFVNSLLADPKMRTVAFRALGTLADGELHVEPIDRPLQPDVGPAKPLDGQQGAAPAEERPSRDANVAVAPVFLELTVRVSGLSSGFDHYVAKYRLPRLREGESFQWELPRPAEAIEATLDGRRVVPAAKGAFYAVTDPLRGTTDEKQPRQGSTLAIEYRTPATMHIGPNWRSVTIPRTDRPVLYFDLAMESTDGICLDGQPAGFSLMGANQQPSWRERLLGAFSRGDGEPVFNPFRRASWSELFAGSSAADDRATTLTWHGADATPPADLTIVIWNSTEVTWWSWVVSLSCLLTGSLLRLALAPWRRGAAIAAAALLALFALALPPVGAALSGSALTGLILVILLPRRLFIFAPRVGPRDSAGVPMGSTQSFVPVAVVLAAVVGLATSLVAHAQDPNSRTAAAQDARQERRQIVDVLIPVGADGKSVKTAPVVYVPSHFMTRLRDMARSAKLPAYLLAQSTYQGAIDDSNRLLITARFVVHVLSAEPVVSVHLPLGLVNLGGEDACQVDGYPHPVVAGQEGRGLTVELSGAEPLAAPPAVPEGEPGSALRQDGPPEAKSATDDEPFPVRTATIELKLYPAVEVGRAGILSGMLAVPRGCQVRAQLSSTSARSLKGVSPGANVPQAAPGSSQARASATIRPGPTNQLLFYWSAAGEKVSRPPSEVQIGVACLADVSPALVEMRYHLAYRVQAGQMDSLVWHVPAGYVLESVQAPQLAGYRFETVAGGARRMLIEFARPQTGDFSLAATFALAVDRYEKQVPLPLLDPLRDEDAAKTQVSLRFHQFALRQPSEFLATVSSTASGQPLKPRLVDEFLKEWNAAGPRPQHAFDLERAFALNVVLDQQPSVPAVRGASTGRFHPGRLDWTYTAEVSQPAAPQFLYRLHLDPRLRIRSVSVQEDGAERLLRPAQFRDTVVLFLNDRATRSQTVRIEASLPVAVSQVIELPRIRFAGATPGAERVTLYHDADVAVRLANPEDFPQPDAGTPVVDSRGDRLVGRIDVLPEQSSLRVAVEPVLPVIATEVATVLESIGDRWHFTTGVEFQVASGRMNDFAVEVPEALAARIETRSVPASHVSRHPGVGGRVTLSFHTDEPALRRFVAILNGPVEINQPSWQLPAFEVPGAGTKATYLFVPRGLMEPAFTATAAEVAVVPDWIAEVVATTTNAPLWNSYLWPGEAPAGVEFRRKGDGPSRTLADDARIEIWIQKDGSVHGWLSMVLVGNLAGHFELDWPETAHPMALFANGAFRTVPVPASGILPIRLPPAATGRQVWISWTDSQPPLPVWSDAPAGRLPWPRQVPVANCHVNVHLPQEYQAKALAPLAGGVSASLPGVVPAIFSQPEARSAQRPGDVSLVMMPVPGPGKPVELGTLLRITNRRPVQFAAALAAALLVVLVSWKTGPFWNWLPQHETCGWLFLAAFWWLCLEPSWVGIVIAAWACFAAMRRQKSPEVESPATTDAPAVG